MTQRQLFAVALRILGAYLLVEAVMQVPGGVVNGIILCVFWLRGIPSNPYLAALWPTIATSCVGFVLYAASGWYLLRGAPALVRMAGIESPTAAAA